MDDRHNNIEEYSKEDFQQDMQSIHNDFKLVANGYDIKQWCNKLAKYDVVLAVKMHDAYSACEALDSHISCRLESASLKEGAS